ETTPNGAGGRSLLGWVLERPGKVTEGLAILEKVARDEQLARQPEVWEHVGDVYLLADRPEKAREAWQKALALFPHTTDPADRRKKAIEGKLRAIPRASD